MRKILVLALAMMMVLAMVPTVAMAAGGTASTPEQLESVLASAGSGDTVVITASMTLTQGYTIKAGVTLTASPGVVVSVSGTGERFIMQSGATIEGVTINKIDKTGVQNIIYLRSSCTVKNCTITGQYVNGDNDVSRAMVTEAGATDILIEGNTIRALRQPAYIEGGVTGMIKNNKVYGTRGWVVCLNSNCTFSGNVFGGNVFDFAIIKNVNAPNSGAYDNIAKLSADNNGAYVEYQLTDPYRYAANGIEFEKGKGTVVTAGVDPAFTITIPATVSFGTLAPGAGTVEKAFDVTASNVVIERGSKISVAVNSTFKMLAGSAELPYVLKNADDTEILSGNEFASFTGNRTENGKVSVNRADIVNAGNYQGTMTFTISYQ